jgi:hypothetical protein
MLLLLIRSTRRHLAVTSTLLGRVISIEEAHLSTVIIGREGVAERLSVMVPKIECIWRKLTLFVSAAVAPFVLSALLFETIIRQYACFMSEDTFPNLPAPCGAGSPPRCIC